MGRPDNPVGKADKGRADGCQTHPSPSRKAGGDGNLMNQFKLTAFDHGWTQINTDKGENRHVTGPRSRVDPGQRRLAVECLGVSWRLCVLASWRLSLCRTNRQRCCRDHQRPAKPFRAGGWWDWIFRRAQQPTDSQMPHSSGLSVFIRGPKPSAVSCLPRRALQSFRVVLGCLLTWGWRTQMRTGALGGPG